MLAEIFGPDLLIVVLVVVVVLFGGAAIPKLARNLGSAKKEFEKGIKDGHEATDGSATGTTPAGPSTNGVATRPVGDSGPVTPK
jgi:sec-independent protein translocase protein TatA